MIQPALRRVLISSALLGSNVDAQSRDSIRSSLLTVDVRSGRIDTIYSDTLHFEAPNWSPDGRFFIVNSRGRLYRLAARGRKQLTEIPTGFATRANNDHGISPDGKQLVISHHAAEYITDPTQDWLASTIYVLPIRGSASPVKVTTKAPSFWHGWSPDGRTLAYVGRRDGEFDIYTIPVSGGDERRLTTCRGLDDGPDYSPDGRFIYYNSFCSGTMQIWRMRADGSRPEQLTRDAYSNWFPHPSPDGRWVVYLAYLEDQGESHPFGRQVKLRLMDLRNGSVRDLTRAFFGGQGTLNVPSWSSDSRHVAFVSYEIVSPSGANIFQDTARAISYTERHFNLQRPGARDSLRALLRRERALWDARKPRDYRYLLRIDCFCPGPRGWLVMEVRENRLVRASDRSGRAVPITDWNTRSVDQLFDNLERSVDSDGRVSIAFDPRWHFPSYVRSVARIGPDSWGVTEARGFQAIAR